MNGYEWSIWYVPKDWKKFMNEYEMKHVPHMTIETNLIIKPTTVKTQIMIDKITFKSGLVKLPSQYDNDPLDAIGWYCDTPQEWNYGHKPHVTWKYNSDMESTITTPMEMSDLFLAIADTRSGDPSEWTFEKILQG